MKEMTITEANQPNRYPLYIKIFILIIKLLGYFLTVLILGGIFGEGMAMLAPDLDRGDMLVGELKDWKSMSILYFGMVIAAIIVTWIFRKGIDNFSIQTLGLARKNIGFKLAKGAVWAMTIQSIVFGILYLFGTISFSIGNFEWADLLGFIVLFLLISIHEELIFRGYVISLLARDIHYFPTLLIGALIFAGAHIGNADFTWMGFGSIFLGGYLLGILFLKNQDLYLPIGLHWLWNYYQGNILGFDVSGLDIPCFLNLEMKGNDWLTGGEFGLEGSGITVLLLLVVTIFLTVKWHKELLIHREPIANL